MFTSGFEKTAFVAKAIGAVRGTAAKATKMVSKGVRSFVDRQRESGIEAYRKASTGKARKPGEGLYNSRARNLAAKGKAPGFSEAQTLEKKTKQDIGARATRMQESAKANKKSFAGKHPFLTAGGLYLGARYAFSGGDGQSQQQQPQAIPGQY